MAAPPPASDVDVLLDKMVDDHVREHCNTPRMLSVARLMKRVVSPQTALEPGETDLNDVPEWPTETENPIRRVPNHTDVLRILFDHEPIAFFSARAKDTVFIEQDVSHMSTASLDIVYKLREHQHVELTEVIWMDWGFTRDIKGITFPLTAEMHLAASTCFGRVVTQSDTDHVHLMLHDRAPDAEECDECKALPGLLACSLCRPE